jgi:hypothetical protein
MTTFVVGTISASAKTDSGTSGSITWSFNDSTGALKISRTNKNDGVVKMPSTYSTSNLPPWTRKYANKITSVTVGPNISYIGNYAFYGLTKCTTITIGKSVTTIGAGSFGKCKSLTKFEVNSNNSYFKTVSNVLYNASKTTLVAFPANKKVGLLAITKN